MSNALIEQTPTSNEMTVAAHAESARSQAEIQAALLMARANPRNEQDAIDAIMLSCQRLTLAQDSEYEYVRGGKQINGANIRLMEVVACKWRNIQHGYRVLSIADGRSDCEAFAWDVENNTKVVLPFSVRHVRSTRDGEYPLTDDRDIYELVANYGSRRVRTCLEKVIPRDVVEQALDQCHDTLKAKVEVTPELIQTIVKTFADLGISKDRMEAKYQRKIESITAAQVLQLRRIIAGIKDGFTTADDAFPKVKTDQPVDADAFAERMKQGPISGPAAEGTASAEAPTESAALRRWLKTINSSGSRAETLEVAAECDGSSDLSPEDKAICAQAINDKLSEQE